MKKLLFAFVSACMFLFAACEKELDNSIINNGDGTITRTFKVSMAGSTKTHLDGMSIKWNADDEINVIGITAGGTVTEHTFTLKTGANTSNAVFEGTVNEDETTFYAVYPNVAIDKTKIVAATPLILPTSRLNGGSDIQTAVEDGFDSNYAFMTAVEDGSGNFTFRHGVAFFKIEIGEDDVVNVNFSTSNTRFYGRPSINASDGSFNTIEGAQNNVNVAGSFVNGSVYYVPVLVKNSALGNLTITYTFNDATTAFVTTSKMSSTKLAFGKVYDLGVPPISKPSGPVVTLSKTSVSDLAAAGGVGLTITSAYTITSGSDSDINVTVDGTVVTSASVSGGTVTYTLTENESSSPRSGWIGLQAGTGSVLKITINQLGVAASLTAVSTTTTWGSALWTSIQSEVGPDAVSGQFVESNMRFISGGKIKFGSSNSTKHCQLGGGGSSSSVCMQIMVSGNGKISFSAAASGDNSNRYLVVSNGATEQGSVAIPYKSTKTEDEINVTASDGDTISIYSRTSTINVYSITWTPAP